VREEEEEEDEAKKGIGYKETKRQGIQVDEAVFDDILFSFNSVGRREEGKKRKTKFIYQRGSIFKLRLFLPLIPN
jgi:hypothetical protein